MEKIIKKVRDCKLRITVISNITGCDLLSCVLKPGYETILRGEKHHDNNNDNENNDANDSVN